MIQNVDQEIVNFTTSIEHILSYFQMMAVVSAIWEGMLSLRVAMVSVGWLEAGRLSPILSHGWCLCFGVALISVEHQS